MVVLHRPIDLMLWFISLPSPNCVDFIGKGNIVAVDFVRVDAYNRSYIIRK